MLKKCLAAAILVCASGAATAGPLGFGEGRPIAALANLGNTFLNPLIGPVTSAVGNIAGNIVSNAVQTGILSKVGTLVVQPARGVILPTIVVLTPGLPGILPGLR